MKLKETITIEEIHGSTLNIRIVEAIENGRAALTHYLKNNKNGASKYYKKEARNYVKHLLEFKYPEGEIKNSVAEDALQYLLFNYRENHIPFPTPENSNFTFIDLFAGIGGFRMAMQGLRGKCIFTSEWDEAAKRTYEANFGEVPFGDITKEQIQSFIPSKFDILCAGFPCQPFSYAGKNEGFEDKTRGTLFYEVCRILKDHKPKMFLLENVKGLKSHKEGETLKIILESLKNLGYKIFWKILNSYDFGLPQYRERWYCVGFLDDVAFEFPEGNLRGSKLRDIIDIDVNDKKLMLSNFEIERIEYHFNQATNGERIIHDNSKYAPHTKKGRHGVYSYQKPDKSLRFHVGDSAKTQIQEAFYACLDTYAPTIIANRVPKMWDLRRRLSVKESARLQGFPDNFVFPVSDAQAYKQLGNSISVPVVSEIIKNMLYFYDSADIKKTI
jgi:DNA (cytosine-5)-methyltransferase 1